MPDEHNEPSIEINDLWGDSVVVGLRGCPEHVSLETKNDDYTFGLDAARDLRDFLNAHIEDAPDPKPREYRDSRGVVWHETTAVTGAYIEVSIYAEENGNNRLTLAEIDAKYGPIELVKDDDTVDFNRAVDEQISKECKFRDIDAGGNCRCGCGYSTESDDSRFDAYVELVENDADNRSRDLLHAELKGALGEVDRHRNAAIHDETEKDPFPVGCRVQSNFRVGDGPAFGTVEQMCLLTNYRLINWGSGRTLAHENIRDLKRIPRTFSTCGEEPPMDVTRLRDINPLPDNVLNDLVRCADGGWYWVHESDPAPDVGWEWEPERSFVATVVEVLE